MKRLQINTPLGWKWVFCRNAQDGEVTLSFEKSNALKGEGALEYFQRHFANNIFRLAKNLAD